MAALEDFENTLKEVVNAKRLSASKMTRLTEIAMKSLEDDTKLVAILYRTHKSLPSSAKVSSLYAFDALARAARNLANKHGPTGDLKSEKGNQATFLLKIQGVLDGLFQDMVAIGSSEAKDKTKKVLDIWVKSNTFPSAVLTRLRDILSDVQKGAYQNPNMSAQTTPTATPDAQAALLALLGQAAQITGQNQTASANNQTSPNTEPVLKQAQVALLQQLALTAKFGNGTQTLSPGGQTVSPIPPTGNPSVFAIPASEPSHSYTNYLPAGVPPRNSQGDARYAHSGHPDRARDRQESHDDRYPPRGGFRGGYRGRGHNTRDDHNNHDRFRHRDRNWDPTSRPRRKQPNPRSHSPSYRPTNGKDPHYQGKDEFGRDIRTSSVSPPISISMSVENTPTQTPMDPSVVPASGAAPDCRIPVSDHTSAQTASQQQPGLDQFDITMFDATAPSSWEALGNMWQTTYGYVPSQEELMHFVITGNMVAGATNGAFGGVEGGQWQQAGWEVQGSRGDGGWRGGRGRGRGRGSNTNGRRGGNFGHGNYRDGLDTMQKSEPTYAIVLNGDGDQSTSQTETSTGGRMQRVGDKWMFVRDPASGAT
ncbi:hypothetical protein BU15DRAFT_87564 [Melanogaster broomeanus]|nr:hypothetical protein BU15DRAFT_87564 [Melanogaster broomeanus]